MSIRSECIVVRSGTVLAYYDRHGGSHCALSLSGGPELAAEFAEMSSGDGPDPTLLGTFMYDGGYLVDFDERVAIVFGHPDFGLIDPKNLDQADRALRDEGPSAYFAAIAPRYSGWTLRWDECGVDAFLWHLDRRRLLDQLDATPLHTTCSGDHLVELTVDGSVV